MEQFVEMFRDAAAVVGIEAARVWPQMVLLHWIKAVWAVFLFVAVLPLSLFIGVRSVRLGFAEREEFEKRDTNLLQVKVIVGSVVGLAVGMFLLIGLLIGGGSTLGTLIAPEASLVKQIISQTANK